MSLYIYFAIVSSKMSTPCKRRVGGDMCVIQTNICVVAVNLAHRAPPTSGGMCRHSPDTRVVAPPLAEMLHGCPLTVSKRHKCAFVNKYQQTRLPFSFNMPSHTSAFTSGLLRSLGIVAPIIREKNTPIGDCQSRAKELTWQR